MPVAEATGRNGITRGVGRCRPGRGGYQGRELGRRFPAAPAMLVPAEGGNGEVLLLIRSPVPGRNIWDTHARHNSVMSPGTEDGLMVW